MLSRHGIIVRRELLWFLAAGAAWPFAGQAQDSGRTKRVAVLSALSADSPIIKARLDVLKQELASLGWSPDQNLTVDYRFGAGESDRYPSLAQELVATRPDVILAHTTQVANAVQRATRDIPVVLRSATSSGRRKQQRHQFRSSSSHTRSKQPMKSKACSSHSLPHQTAVSWYCRTQQPLAIANSLSR